MGHIQSQIILIKFILEPDSFVLKFWESEFCFEQNRDIPPPPRMKWSVPYSFTLLPNIRTIVAPLMIPWHSLSVVSTFLNCAELWLIMANSWLAFIVCATHIELDEDISDFTRFIACNSSQGLPSTAWRKWLVFPTCMILTCNVHFTNNSIMKKHTQYSKPIVTALCYRFTRFPNIHTCTPVSQHYSPLALPALLSIAVQFRWEVPYSRVT